MREKCYVVPVELESVQGRNNAMIETPGGSKYRRGNHTSSGISIPIPFFKDTTGSKLVTGLEDMVINPYHKDMGSSPDLPSNWVEHKDWISKQDKISKQILLEIEGNLVKGTLHNNVQAPSMIEVNNNKNLLKDYKQSYLESFVFYVSANTVTPIDNTKGIKSALGIQAVKNAPFIAKSKEEVNINKHKFYITDLEEVNDSVRLSQKQTMKAIAKLEKLENEWTSRERYKFGVVLNIMTQNDIADNLVINELRDFVWSQKKDVVHGTLDTRLNKFDKTWELFEKEPKRFHIEYIYKQAKNAGLFVEQAGTLFWRTQREKNESFYNLGSNINKVKERLYLDRDNFDEFSDDSNMYGVLMTELQAKHILI